MHFNKAYLYTFFIIVLLSCAESGKKEDAPTDVQKLFKDDLGRGVLIKNEPERVVGLCPSITELLFELDSSTLVGRTDNCNYPSTVVSLPDLSVYPKVDKEKLLQLKPDLVVSLVNMLPREEADQLENLGIPVVLFKIDDRQSLIGTIGKLGELLDKQRAAEKMKSKLSDKVLLSYGNKSKGKALALVSIDPIYVHGENSWFGSILSELKYVNVAAAGLGSYPRVSREYLVGHVPDFLFYGGDSSQLEGFFNLYPELKEAFVNTKIRNVDGDLMSRPTTRCVELYSSLNEGE